MLQHAAVTLRLRLSAARFYFRKKKRPHISGGSAALFLSPHDLRPTSSFANETRPPIDQSLTHYALCAARAQKQHALSAVFKYPDLHRGGCHTRLSVGTRATAPPLLPLSMLHGNKRTGNFCACLKLVNRPCLPQRLKTRQQRTGANCARRVILTLSLLVCLVVILVVIVVILVVILVVIPGNHITHRYS